MGQLHELIAKRTPLAKVATAITEETKKTFSTKSERFEEILKTYEPLVENGHDMPADHKPMNETVGNKLSYYVSQLKNYMDAEFQLDITNQQATASLTLGDKVLEGIPVTYLMQLERFLTQMREVFKAIPTLSPGTVWEEDVEKAEKGIYRATPIETYREVKNIEVRVVVQPTDKHPAQTKEVPVVERIGKYTTNRWSGMISTAAKSRLLAKLDDLYIKVRQAHSQANSVDHATGTIADQLFSYLLEDIPVAEIRDGSSK